MTEKRDCFIVKDLLPLYSEKMLSDETTEYVKEHLEKCTDCMNSLKSLQESSSIDETFECENKDTAGDAVPLKRIKKKIKRNMMITVSAAVVLTVVVIFLAQTLKPATFDYGNSEMFSLEDRKEVVQIIENKIDSMEGCKLYSISYTSDELCKKELDHWNTVTTAKNGAKYTECIVFTSSFRSPIFGDGIWIANCVYNWDWYFARTENGEWEELTHGMG